MTNANDSGKPATHRRWCQFSLRTLLILVAVFAAWLGPTTYRARQQRQAVEAIAGLNALIVYDHQIMKDSLAAPTLGSIYYIETGRNVTYDHEAGEPPGPAWLRRCIGDEYFQEVVAVDVTYNSEGRVTDEDLRQVAKLRSLRRLVLDDTYAGTDEGLAHLSGLPHVERLFLAKTRTTDQGLVHLRGLSSLKYLSLAGTKITDDGLKHLWGLSNLEMLELCNTSVSDAGLEHLRGLKNLKYVWLYGTRVTEEGAAKLAKELPGGRVTLAAPGVIY